MKAIVQDRYGDVDVLDFRDIDQPVPTDSQVLVRVHAAAVGKGDWLSVQSLPYVARVRYGLPNPKHPVPGFDVAGVCSTNSLELVRSIGADHVIDCARLLRRSGMSASVPPKGKPSSPREEQAAAAVHGSQYVRSGIDPMP